ncbi:Bug family tripartite tricarboxylate transporter substrate binding protein [Sediminicoccus rosea]|jgi:tripartite-type tricarboxylate transporter receptor subunit TctC|uniref:Tripartite tricarboxylate transporter substrate binding protein n=1 Tax=Sediminicoccus rosea TaxID=1225128 RepID=A0ABZ0PFU7_9PROT|nr:tripartite tricarboxylate transporter substrate binding protein [Sediminicoccus rosea]WPB84588.1 tripartite tricarboxylate transporter substrate binding protein [Sediminicoccus rosea]
MMLNRRSLLAAPALLPLAAAAQTGAQAPWQPSRQLRIIVPFSPGGSTDVGGRIIAERLSETLGQPVVVENRTGAGGAVGVEAAARSPADGYTMLVATNGVMTQAPHLGLMRAVDVRRELTYLSKIFTTDVIVVIHPSIPAQTLQEFVAYVRARPGQLSFATSGVGSGTHIFTELFMAVTGTQMVHVPYRGSGQAMADLVNGTVQVMLDQPASSIGQVRARAIRALATSGPARIAVLPDLPTFAEAGFGEATVQSWGSIAVPTGTPQPAQERLAAAVREAVSNPGVISRMAAAGLVAVGNTQAEMTQFAAQEFDRWGQVIRARNIRVD